jgi:hypothetical protein
VKASAGAGGRAAILVDIAKRVCWRSAVSRPRTLNLLASDGQRWHLTTDLWEGAYEIDLCCYACCRLPCVDRRDWRGRPSHAATRTEVGTGPGEPVGAAAGMEPRRAQTRAHCPHSARCNRRNRGSVVRSEASSKASLAAPLHPDRRRSFHRLSPPPPPPKWQATARYRALQPPGGPL